MKASRNKVGKVERFIYLGLILHKDGSFEDDMKRKMKCGWIK